MSSSRLHGRHKPFPPIPEPSVLALDVAAPYSRLDERERIGLDLFEIRARDHFDPIAAYHRLL
jgi:hypothetical protein